MPVINNSDAHNNAHEEALHWIVRLNSGETDTGQHEAFAQWRSTHPLNDLAAKEAEALWASMSNLHVDPSSGLMRLEPVSKRITRRDMLKGFVFVGAAGSLGGMLWGSGILRKLSADYVSMTAEVQTIGLSDGSRVTLNARSAVDVKFDKNIRQVILKEGQAYFEVAPDVSRPFEVEAGLISIVALGTKFDVSRNLADAAIEVSVAEHAVLIRSGAASPRKLSEGQQVTFDKTGTMGPVRRQDVTSTTSWRDGAYIAEDRSLGDIVAALSAWHSGVIYLRDSSVAKLRVNTVLNLKDPIGSLSTLEAGLPIEINHYSSLFTVISMA